MADRPSPWEQLARGVDLPFHPDLRIPPMYEVTLDVPQPEPLADAESAARAAVVSRLRSAVTPGMTILNVMTRNG